MIKSPQCPWNNIATMSLDGIFMDYLIYGVIKCRSGKKGQTFINLVIPTPTTNTLSLWRHEEVERGLKELENSTFLALPQPILHKVAAMFVTWRSSEKSAQTFAGAFSSSICLQRRKMAHLEFCIPATSRDELVQSSKKGQYIVRRLLSDPAEIEQKVEGKWFRARYTQSLVNHLSCLVYFISWPFQCLIRATLRVQPVGALGWSGCCLRVLRCVLFGLRVSVHTFKSLELKYYLCMYICTINHNSIRWRIVCQMHAIMIPYCMYLPVRSSSLPQTVRHFLKVEKGVREEAWKATLAGEV